MIIVLYFGGHRCKYFCCDDRDRPLTPYRHTSTQVPVPARGQLAQSRRRNFKWTAEMSQWFAGETDNLSKKAISFAELREQAEAR